MKRTFPVTVTAAVTAVTVAVLFTVTGAAFAQNVDAGDDDAAIETIIVTAQHREQNIQSVPLAIHVLTADNIKALASDNLGDLDVFIPGLNVGSGSPTQPRFAIRGVSTSDFGVGTDPAVGVYVDGVYAARSGAALLAFSDVQRVEVIKGPQGTLFGRNSAAGAVAVVTNAPGSELEGALNLRAGEFGKRRAEALVNLPLGDALALRVNALLNERDGLFHDADSGEDYARQDNWAARAEVRWQPRDATEFRLRYTRDEIDQDARPAIGVVPIPDFPAQPSAPPPPRGLLISPLTAPVRNDVIGNSERRELDEVTLHMTHEFANEITLHGIAAHRKFTTNNREDEDGTNRRDLYFDTNNVEDNESIYAELRLSGASENLNWLFGVSWNQEDAVQRSEAFATVDSIDKALSSSEDTGFMPLFSVADSILGPLVGSSYESLLGTGWSEIMYNEGDYEAFAVFADAEWHFSEQLSVTVGARYTDDEKSFSWFNDRRVAPELDAKLSAYAPVIEQVVMSAPTQLGFLDILPTIEIVFDWGDNSNANGFVCDNGVAVAEGATCVQRGSWSDISPRFVLNYTPRDDLLLFASYTQGYKAGGFNSVEVGSRFANEDVENFELGAKWSSSDGALRASGSVFHYDYLDKQSIRLTTPTGSSVPQYVVQTSDESADGLDLQLTWTPARATSLFANLQYIDVVYDHRVLAGNAADPTDDINLAGQPTGEPKWSVALGASQHLNFAQRGALELRVLHAYQSESECNADDTGAVPCGAFIGADRSGKARHRTDLRAYFRNASERYTLGIFVNNVFDNQYIDGINNLTGDTLGTLFGSITPPRIWGVDFEFRY